MKYLGIGCTGCGSLLALTGIAALALTLLGFVQESEEITGLSIGGSACVLSLFAFIVGAVVLAIARKRAAAAE